MVRVIQIAVLTVFCFLMAGCTPKPDNNIPGNLKVQNLAPVYREGSPGDNILKAISIDFHILDIPEENFSKLDEIRRTLNVRPIKFNKYLAFSANSFSAYYGRNQTRRTVYDLLQIAGAQHVTNQAIILVNGESSDIPIQQLPQTQVIYFSNLSGDLESARIGPGYITLHISVEKADTLDDAATVKMFPLFTRMATNTISQYAELEKLKDFPFYSAALQLDMIPGDFIFLAPERSPGSLVGHTPMENQEQLSNLFFDNPQGSMFFDPKDKKPPERKPSIRVYLITCLGLNF